MAARVKRPFVLLSSRLVEEIRLGLTLLHDGLLHRTLLLRLYLIADLHEILICLRALLL